MNTLRVRGFDACALCLRRWAMAVVPMAASSFLAARALAVPIGPGEVGTVVPEPGKGGPKITLAVPTAEGTIEVRELNGASETMAIQTIEFDPPGTGTYRMQVAYRSKDGTIWNIGDLFPVELGGQLHGTSDTEWEWECTELSSGKWIWSSSDGTVITWDPIIHEMEVRGLNGYFSGVVPPPAVGALASVVIQNNTRGILDARAAFSVGDAGPVEYLHVSPSDEPHASAFDIKLRWKLELDEELLQQETGDAVIQFTVDGSAEASLIMPIVITAGSGLCSGSPCSVGCGSASVDGISYPMTCDTDTCTCKTPIFETTLGANLALLPGQVLGLDVRFSPSTFPQRAFSGTLEWGAWQRRVVDARVAPQSDGLHEISLDWVMEVRGDARIPVLLGTSARGTYLEGVTAALGCDDLTYYDCPDCCLEVCECSGTGPNPGGNYFVIMGRNLGNDLRPCSTRLDCPLASINGMPATLSCDSQTSLCQTPVFTNTLRAPLQPGQSFIAYLKPIPGAVPELDYSRVGVDVGPQVMAQDYKLASHTIGSGGGFGADGKVELYCTIGQPVAGPSSGGGFELSGGFLSGVAASTGVDQFPDCDGDGMITLADYQCFHICLAGPNVNADAGCTEFDLDDSGAVDAKDASVFQNLFGSSIGG